MDGSTDAIFRKCPNLEGPISLRTIAAALFLPFAAANAIFPSHLHWPARQNNVDHHDDHYSREANGESRCHPSTSPQYVIRQLIERPGNLTLNWHPCLHSFLTNEDMPTAAVPRYLPMLAIVNASILPGPGQTFHIDRRMPLRRQASGVQQSVFKWDRSHQGLPLTRREVLRFCRTAAHVDLGGYHELVDRKWLAESHI